LAAPLAESLGLSGAVQKLCGYAAAEAEPQTWGYARKARGFPQGQRPSRATNQVSSGYLLVVRQAGMLCVNTVAAPFKR
jgi:hypothetical protein